MATRAAGIAAGAFALFLGVLAPSSVFYFRWLQEETIGQEQLAVATAVAAALEARLDQVRQVLLAVASGLGPELLDNPVAATAFLDSRLALFAVCDSGAYLVDRRGQMLASSHVGAESAKVDRVVGDALEPWIRAPAPGVTLAEHPVITVGVPIRRGDIIVGQLVGRVDLVEGRFLSDFSAMRIGKAGYLSLTTTERVVLMHREPARRFWQGSVGSNLAVGRGLEGYEGWLRTRTSLGVEMIAAVKPLPSTGWVLVANYPLSEAHGPYNRSLAWFGAGAVLGIFALLVWVWRSMQGLAAPLVEMARQVEALTKGGSSVAPVVVHSDDEVGTLATAFNHLAQELSQSRAEQSRTEAALRQSEERFRLAFKTSPEPMLLQRADDSVLVAVNDGFLQLHGLTEAEVLGKTLLDLGLLAVPEERARVATPASRTEVIRGRDVHVHAADGRIHVLSLSSSIVTIDGVRHTLVLGRDVTEERQLAAERERLAMELRQSEERYLAAIRSLPVVQWVVNEEGVFIHSEGQGLAALGLKAGEVVGRSITEVYAASPGLLGAYERARAGESFVTVDEFGQTAFESHWAPVRDPSGRIVGVTGIAQDITARRQAEARLVQAQKMEAVGRLASGIAHDFNNLLAVILGGCSYLVSEPGVPPSSLEVLSEIRAAGDRAARLVKQLLTFGRKGVARPVRCTLTEVVGGLETLIRRAIGENIEVVVHASDDPWSVQLDPDQIDQVLMNLAVNARDAMPNGGRLTIETSNVERSTSSEGEPPPGRWACLAVSDNGLGMPVEVQARMFDPFFTTKEVGRGTGRGLSTVLGAVQQANGRITVDSRPGGGTSFRLYFPVADASASTEKEDAVKAPAVPRRLTVLAVEDDPAVRRSTVRMLVGCGFEAKEASTAEEGLELIERGGVDLLLTDVVMPGMSGPDLVCRLRALGSELPVVFASGYMEGGLHAVPDGAVVLTKPYAAPELTEAVARALSAKR